MKPSLRRLRERYEIATAEKKEEIQNAASMHNRAKRFQRDKGLVEWFDEHCKGKMTREVQPELQRGLEAKEITYDQAVLVLDFLTDQGFLSA